MFKRKWYIIQKVTSHGYCGTTQSWMCSNYSPYFTRKGAIKKAKEMAEVRGVDGGMFIAMLTDEIEVNGRTIPLLSVEEGHGE